MVLLHSTGKPDNFKAPDFSLTNIDGRTLSLNDCMGEHGLLVMFICNHCPYVLGIIDRLVTTCTTLQENGIGCVAIMPNDTENYPADSFDNMKIFVQNHNFTFPYLIDLTQDVTKAYDAVCTPDFFGFNADGILQYRGRLDSAANKPAEPTTVPELLNAMMQMKDTGEISAHQVPSMGCSIKWREEQFPHD